MIEGMYASSKKSCSYLKLSIEGNDIYIFLNKIASFIMQEREKKQFETGLEK